MKKFRHLQIWLLLVVVLLPLSVLNLKMEQKVTVFISQDKLFFRKIHGGIVLTCLLRSLISAS